MTRRNESLDIHGRCERALIELHAGLLEEGEQRWLQEHLAACDSCRQLADDMRDGLELSGGSSHLPVRLLSRWNEESGRLPEIVRAEAIHHLRGCDTCRGALRVAGQTPPPEVEPRVAALAPSVGLPAWLIRGAIALAGAAAVIAIVAIVIQERGRGTDVAAVRPAPPHATSPSGPKPPSPAGTEDRGSPAPTDAPVALSIPGGDIDASDVVDVSLDEPSYRGAGDAPSPPKVVAGPKVTGLRLSHPKGALLADTGTVRITILMPSGQSAKAEVPAAELRADQPLLLRFAHHVEAGHYKFRYTFARQANDPPIEGDFFVSAH